MQHHIWDVLQHHASTTLTLLVTHHVKLHGFEKSVTNAEGCVTRRYSYINVLFSLGIAIGAWAMGVVELCYRMSVGEGLFDRPFLRNVIPDA